MWSGPNRDKAIASYRSLVSVYDASCRRIEDVRRLAIEALQLSPGDTVLDVACGTGSCLATLAGKVGPGGRVIGIEQSPEMAVIARERAIAIGPNVEVLTCSVEEMPPRGLADAMLFCFTHDVLQSERAIARLVGAAKPGCRIALAGSRFLPWWGAPINAFTAFRVRHYVSTYRGLQQPWLRLAAFSSDLTVIQSFHAGTTYLAKGKLRSA